MQQIIESIAAAEGSASPPAPEHQTAGPPPGAAPPRLRARVLRGGVWAVFGKCWNSLLIVLANALLARILSLADFAAFLLGFSCVSVLGNLGTFGLSVGIVRYVAESLSTHNVRRARQVALKSWLTSLAGSLIIAAAFGAVLAAVGSRLAVLEPLAPVAWHIAAWIVLHALAVMQGETFRGFHKIGPASVFGTPYNLPFLLGLSWLTFSGSGSLSTVLWLVLACQGVNLLVGYVWLVWLWTEGERDAGGASVTPDANLGWAVMVRESLPLAVTTVTGLLMAQLDLWIVAAFCSSTDLAIYGAVTRLMLLVSTPLNIVNNVVPPLVADLHTRGQSRQMEQMLRSTATLATLPALAMFLFVLAGSGWLLTLFYGDAYRAGAAVLIVLSCGQLINAWCGSAGSALNMTRQQRGAMIAVVFSGVVLLTLGPLAARAGGILGAALASASATALQKILLCWLVWRLLGIRAYGTLNMGFLRTLGGVK